VYAATRLFDNFANLHGKLSPAFTRALACMSKYSDELYINAMPNSVSFSATNTSLSAYCRFTYDRNFFTKFNVGDRNVRDGIPDLDDAEQSQTVTGQLCVQVLPLRRKMCFHTQQGLSQPLLAILKHKTLEKTLERLDLMVVDGVFNHEDEDFDSLEGKLIVRLHCKHGEVTILACRVHTETNMQ
jgi:cell cycle checkpoint control protein RAD9A